MHTDIPLLLARCACARFRRGGAGSLKSRAIIRSIYRSASAPGPLAGCRAARRSAPQWPCKRFSPPPQSQAVARTTRGQPRLETTPVEAAMQDSRSNKSEVYKRPTGDKGTKMRRTGGGEVARKMIFIFDSGEASMTVGSQIVDLLQGE